MLRQSCQKQFLGYCCVRNANSRMPKIASEASTNEISFLSTHKTDILESVECQSFRRMRGYLTEDIVKRLWDKKNP